LLSGVLLFLAFVGLLVILLARVVVGVVVRRTCVVVVGVIGGGLVVGLLWFTGVVFMSDFSFSFPISCIGILGLLSHEEQGFWFAVTLRDLILEAIWESFIKSVLKGGVTPIAARG
jgi:hypothetical protein